MESIEQKEQPLEERARLKEELKSWTRKFVDASNKLNGLLPKLHGVPSSAQKPDAILNKEFVSKYKKAEKEKMEADAKRREILEKILEINRKLQS